MIENKALLAKFVANVKESQTLWGLQDKAGEGWVVCDSSEYEETDVMPIWSNKEQAEGHCTQEWQDYVAVAIPLEEFMEYWVSDLNDDGVLVGLDWEAETDCLEMDPIELAKELVNIEQE
ncbi:DUF2750 domain-containing protein [Shewanella gelidii]|uniref:DUF2750 domain-containing protein n=1 Tax=Shewanella gelidii TaxID=1642821 RepID=A0A917N8L5_9GAMM|nr:DUF2750 domain-containing protein [Shewanella gelidii]MCL1099241.1 DUF2750 domain-containing protein [Shewanella gelidii]GGI76685.1 hypothetical protein GCM10009332_12590 [Shewanella gelidii]